MQHTSAVLQPTFAPPSGGQARVLPTAEHSYDSIWQEAESWQRKSSDASSAEMIADMMPGTSAIKVRVRRNGQETLIHPGEGVAPRTPNRKDWLFFDQTSRASTGARAWTPPSAGSTSAASSVPRSQPASSRPAPS